MSSWKDLIGSGSRDLAAGVAGMVVAGTDKVADLADQVAGKLDRLAVHLLLDATGSAPKTVSRDEMIAKALELGYTQLGGNTWDWLERRHIQRLLELDHKVKLRRDSEGRFFLEDLKHLVETVPVSGIRQYGAGKVELLKALTADL